jgi:hypothetical protein
VLRSPRNSMPAIPEDGSDRSFNPETAQCWRSGEKTGGTSREKRIYKRESTLDIIPITPYATA